MEESQSFTFLLFERTPAKIKKGRIRNIDCMNEINSLDDNIETYLGVLESTWGFGISSSTVVSVPAAPSSNISMSVL